MINDISDCMPNTPILQTSIPVFLVTLTDSGTQGKIIANITSVTQVQNFCFLRKIQNI